MLSQWKLPLFKGLAVAMLLKMVINSFLSHYAEGLFVLFCSILRERDRNPSSCCCSGSSSFPELFDFCCTSANFSTRQGSSKTNRGCAASASSHRNGRAMGQRTTMGRVCLQPPGPCSPLSSAAGPANPAWTWRYRRHPSLQAGHHRCPTRRAQSISPLPPASLLSCICIPSGLAMWCVLFAPGSYHIAISYFN